ncbi:MAG: hypothetical protein EHM25_10390 [Nitrosopumilales archaeon]|jgi:hypothetical protein|nr:MAG: hypothetical protein EHM25_10390 [Nitrosopumilales archaeon]
MKTDLQDIIATNAQDIITTNAQRSILVLQELIMSPIETMGEGTILIDRRIYVQTMYQYISSIASLANK